jgi:hypothetical protein
MILRRIAEHVKAQNWFAVGIDFVIVVVGVFIGIQVSNWNAGRADRVSERHYLVQLRQDLKLVQVEVRDQIEFEQFQSRLASEIASEIIEPNAQAERRIGAGLSHLANRRTLKTTSPTFVDLQSSGNLEIISDPDLRAAIIACFFRTGRLEAAIDRNNQSFVDQGFMDFVRNEGLAHYEWDNELMGAPRPASVAYSGSAPDPTVARALSAGAAIRVLDTPGLKDKILAQLSWRIRGSSANENMAERILEAVQALDETLAARMDGAAP